MYENTLLGYYNFAPPEFSWSATIPDLSPNGWNLNSLTPDTQWVEPTAPSGSDPIYVNK